MRIIVGSIYTKTVWIRGSQGAWILEKRLDCIIIWQYHCSSSLTMHEITGQLIQSRQYPSFSCISSSTWSQNPFSKKTSKPFHRLCWPYFHLKILYLIMFQPLSRKPMAFENRWPVYDREDDQAWDHPNKSIPGGEAVVLLFALTLNSVSFCTPIIWGVNISYVI